MIKGLKDWWTGKRYEGLDPVEAFLKDHFSLPALIIHIIGLVAIIWAVLKLGS